MRSSTVSRLKMRETANAYACIETYWNSVIVIQVPWWLLLLLLLLLQRWQSLVLAQVRERRWKYMKITSIWQKKWKLADTSLLRYGLQLLYTLQSSISTIFPFIRRNVLLPCLGDVSSRTVGTRRLGWPFLTTSSYLLWTGSMCGRRVEKWTILWGGRGNCTWRKVNQHV